MNDDILNYLQSRTEDAKRNLQHLTDEIQRLQTEKDMAYQDVLGYERTLAAELRARGQSAAPTSQQAVEDDSSINKAEFARRFIRGRATTGVTPDDIYRAFCDARIEISKPYVYSLVQRLKKQEAIRQSRGGKWFPIVAATTESLNGARE